MEKWTVTIFGREITVSAEDRYRAKREAAKSFNATTGNNIAISSLVAVARIRKHKDNRIKYADVLIDDVSLEGSEE